MYVVTVAFHDEPSTPLTQAMAREEADAALDTLRAALAGGDAREEGWVVADTEGGFTAVRPGIVATFRVEPVEGDVMGRVSSRTTPQIVRPARASTSQTKDAAC